MASTSDSVFGLLRTLVHTFFKASTAPSPTNRPAGPGTAARPGQRATAAAHTTPGSPSSAASTLSAPYPGDFHGTARVAYSPNPNGSPDPGEIVWTWVPFEEDYSQGKDRPVLVVGRSGRCLLAVMLTSKDHSNEHRDDDDYIDLGTGPWDARGRPSEVKLDRILQVAAADMRREGSVLDGRRFGWVADGLRRRHGWT